MVMPSEQEMHAAVTARDANFDGRFYYGVVTTGIFCIPSCRSRAARPEHLRFHVDVVSAISAGYRPCMRCHPAGQTPELQNLVATARYIEAHADQSLPLQRLSDHAGCSPSSLQRRFKAAFGISPKRFQDAVRMRRLKVALRYGEKVSDAIYAAGYGSGSRVYGEAMRNLGMTPGAYRRGGVGETLSWACRETALGPMLMAATDRGVCFVQFAETEGTLLERLRAEFPEATLVASPAQHAPELDLWIDALDAHVSADAPRPDLPLDLRGTAFQMLVWRFLLSVAEGEVISYRELAAGLDRPKAARAVASACAANRIGVLVPCHRVLRSDGGLGGYRWGLERKRVLLNAERARRGGVRGES